MEIDKNPIIELALIDADIVAHRVGFTTNDDPRGIAIARCDDMLDRILLDTQAPAYELWLSDSRENNFRQAIYPLYKANRTAPKPKWHEEIKEHLITKWDARIASEMEADDMLGIQQDEEDLSTVICSIDKDLRQIPGYQYNFVKETWELVTHEEAIKTFYKQLIIGDTSDNVPGAYGMGPVKASAAIDPLSNDSPIELEELCLIQARDLWKRAFLKQWGEPWDLAKERSLQSMLLMSGRLLKIKRTLTEPLWDFPSYEVIEKCCALYTPLAQVEIDPSTELTA
jgi:5'-3' exonuclease